MKYHNAKTLHYMSLLYHYFAYSLYILQSKTILHFSHIILLIFSYLLYL